MSRLTRSRNQFRFSLRTMFVAMTLLAIPLAWVAYSLNWMRQRDRLLIDERAAIEALTSSGSFFPPLGPNLRFQVNPPGRLWILGEPGYDYVEVCAEGNSESGLTKSDVTKALKAQSLFPEAQIMVFSYKPGKGNTIGIGHFSKTAFESARE